MTTDYASIQNKHKCTNSQRTTLKSSLSTHKITWYGTQSQKYMEKKKKFLIDFSFWFDQILGSYQNDSYVLCPQKKKQKLANC